MPQWIQEEIAQVHELTREIAESPSPRSHAPRTGRMDLRLSAGLALLPGLAGSARALPVRQLLRALGFDEYFHLQWRIEHKLIQALVLRHWLSDVIPVTCGLSALASRQGPTQLRAFLTEAFPDGYVIKTALGDSSGETPRRDEGEQVLGALESAASPPPAPLLDEVWVVQQCIPIATEYRVHSIEEEVIPDLTFRRYDAGTLAQERDAPNAFVGNLLRQLPNALVGGTLLAWDIALQPSGEFAVIEVNFSGFHPVFKRGFHCSGYYHDQNWGACDTARLLNHVARSYAIEIAVHADAPEHPIENRFYQQLAYWQLRHRGLTVAPPPGEPAAASGEEIIEPLTRAIESFSGPRHRGPVDGEIELKLSAALSLLPELAATTRGVLARQALLALGFDEKRLGCWRLEHKLLQALVFRHYCPGSLPPTRGFDQLTQGVDPKGLRATLQATFPGGYIIKTALGDCSGNEIDRRTEAALAWMESGARAIPPPGNLTDEEFIVQERKAIRREYRIHTIEDRVIRDLTVHRHQGSVAPGEREEPNTYVQEILDRLPAGITAGANLGWDVALLDDNTFATIEVNIGGIHTRWNPGFHASGFFHHRDYGAIYSARLLLFLEQTYRCRITVVADAPDHFDEQFFYADVADWKARFSPSK